jgi:hypothetical protein
MRRYNAKREESDPAVGRLQVTVDYKSEQQQSMKASKQTKNKTSLV